MEDQSSLNQQLKDNISALSKAAAEEHSSEDAKAYAEAANLLAQTYAALRMTDAQLG